MTKSTNKHNRVYLKAEPISEKLSYCIEEGEIKFYGDKEARNERLIK